MIELYIGLSIIGLLSASLIFLGAFSDRITNLKAWFKVGLVLSAIGLTYQSSGVLYHLSRGTFEIVSLLPVWMMTNIGLLVISFSLFFPIVSQIAKAKPKRRTKNVSTRT